MNNITSLYIHFPFCKKLCNYCDFYKSVPNNLEDSISKFEQGFKKQWNSHGLFLSEQNYKWGQLDTVYIGGGTPSLWGKSGAIFLQELFFENQVKLSKDCEFTLEVNPGSWTEGVIESFESVGVNRFSVGLQALNEKMISNLDRYHDFEQSIKALEFFSEKPNVSFDLMIGLPRNVGKRDIEQEISKILEYRPKHLSVYILTTKNNYVHRQYLPEDYEIEEEYLLTCEALKSSGYIHYEVSNFALPGFESRHNLKYWNSETVAAIGNSATGFLRENLHRYKWNAKGELESEVLGQESFKIEQTYMKVRTNLGLSSLDFDSSSREIFKELSLKWVNNGLAEMKLDKVLLTQKGYLLVDSIMNDLFREKLC